MKTAVLHLCRVLAAGVLACTLASNAPSIADGLDGSGGAEPAVGTSEAHFETFLDRLMRAESNGRDLAANPRSSALGPFQFIKATFIDLARRHFGEVASLSDEQVLAMRTDRAFARRAAAIYSMENLAYLSGQGLKPSLGDLRLAYLVGPYGAARVMQAHPETRAADILGATVVKANPFMNGMSAADLIARAGRDVGEEGHTRIAAAPAPHVRLAVPRPDPRAVPRPPLQAAPAAVVAAVRCNQKLVVCRRWIVMQANKQRVAQQAAKPSARKAPNRGGRISGRIDNRPGV